MIPYFCNKIPITREKRAIHTKARALIQRKKLTKYLIWSIGLYARETWTLKKVDIQITESFEMWCKRRMLDIKWTDYKRNEDIMYERLLLIL